MHIIIIIVINIISIIITNTTTTTTTTINITITITIAILLVIIIICMVCVYMLVCVVQVAVQEVRRLQKYGVTAGELANYKAALMRDSEHVAAQWESVPSVDTLDYCMECLALNHTFMAQEEVRWCLFLYNLHIAWTK